MREQVIIMFLDRKTSNAQATCENGKHDKHCRNKNRPRINIQNQSRSAVVEHKTSSAEAVRRHARAGGMYQPCVTRTTNLGTNEPPVEKTSLQAGCAQVTCESKGKARTMNKGTKQALGGTQATCESKSKARTMNKGTKMPEEHKPASGLRSSDMREQEQGKNHE